MCRDVGGGPLGEYGVAVEAVDVQVKVRGGMCLLYPVQR